MSTQDTELLRDSVTSKVEDYEKLEDGMLIELYVSNQNLHLLLEFIRHAEINDSTE